MKNPRCDAVPPARVAVSALAVIALCLAVPMNAVAAADGPVTTGSLSGFVSVARGDPEEPISGLEVRLRSADGDDDPRWTTSDERGRYVFIDVPPGAHVVSVELPGFQRFRREVDVLSGADATLDIALEPAFTGAVTVTATRSERRTEEVPAAVSVVNREQLETTPMTNLKDALGEMPGTLIGSKSQGYDARLVIRGSGLNARYGIREIMVLLNGIPVTDPDSFTRLDFVDTQMIERVEVVRGPNSTLWGINSTGGVINVITRSPAEGGGGAAGVDLGSWGASSLQAHYSGRAADRWFYSLDVSRRQADNDWRVHNEFESTQFTFQPHYVFGDDSVLESYISYTEADLQLPGWLVVDDNRSVDQWTPYLEDGEVEETAEPWKDSARDSKILFMSSRLRTRVGELLVEPLVFVNGWSHFHPVTGKINEADTWVGGIDVPTIWRHHGGTLTCGLTARFDVHDGEAYTYADVVTTPSGRILATESDRKGELMESTEQVTSLYGVYAQESLELGDRWLVDLGLRSDRIRFDISGHEWIEYDYSRGSYAPGPGPVDSDRSYTSLSPRVAAMYRLTQGLNLYGNVSTGAQTPTFSELTTNPDLKLTEVLSYEVGVKGRFSLLSFDAAVYHATVRDEVVQVIQGSGYTEYVNAGETEKIGAELSITAVPAMGLTVGATYAWSHYRFVEFSEPAYGRNIDRAGNQLPFIPEHQMSLFASYAHRSGFLARASASSWGEYFVDNANSETYDGYSFVTEVAAGYQWQGFEVMLMVQNLFDDRYAIEVQKDLYGQLRYAPTAPRSFRVRLTYRF